MIRFAAEEHPLVSVLIVGWRRAPELLECLRSIRTTPPGVPIEVLIALNEPEPGLTEQLEDQVSGVVVQSSRANLGFGGAVNEIARRARGDFLLMLNDDCVVESEWLDALVETMQRRPACGLVGSKFLTPTAGSRRPDLSCGPTAVLTLSVTATPTAIWTSSDASTTALEHR